VASADQIEVQDGTDSGDGAAKESILAVGERPRSGRRSRGLLALFFVGAGVNHLVNPKWYEAIVPPPLQKQAGPVVMLSGVAEIVGGAGVLLPWTRRLSGWGLVAVLAAVFPSNLYMAGAPERFEKIPRWALLARLPLQPLMMWWALRATRR
jgi:uncharacterized membrane protein